MRVAVCRAGTGAFTLLEVLIAITIFSVCVSTVYALYASIMTVVTNVESLSSDNARARVALEQMSSDLSLLYRGERGSLSGSQAESEAGDESFLAFTSNNHLSFDPEETPVELTMVRYYFSQDETAQTFSLLRSDSPVLPGAEDDISPEGRRLVLCEGIAMVRITYADRDGQEFTEWNSSLREEEDQEDVEPFPTVILLDLLFEDDTDKKQEGTEYSTSVFLRPTVLKFSE